MRALVDRYYRWLHGQWPSGRVEKLPEVGPDGTTRMPGVFIVGDLAGPPLLKFALDSGARAARRIVAELPADRDRSLLDLVIVGGGVAGFAAGIEAAGAGVSLEIIEASEPFSTIANFPVAKPIYTYPTGMQPAGALTITADVKESLHAELVAQARAGGLPVRQQRALGVRTERGALVVDLDGGATVRARRVIIAIGRSGNYRKLEVPGEDLPKVSNRLHDPADFAGREVLVVGGGDSAVEAAIALADARAKVTISYRQHQFSRAKPENLRKLDGRVQSGAIRLLLDSRVTRIDPEHVEIVTRRETAARIPNDAVFALIGREAPLEFFRRSGLPIAGEMRAGNWLAFAAFLAVCVFLFHWKKERPELPIYHWFQSRRWFPFEVGNWIASLGDSIRAAAQTPGNLLHVLTTGLQQPGFYYTLVYSLIVVVWGFRRIRRRRTPYVRIQTYALMAIQCIPLFILPEILLPWAGENGWFSAGLGKWLGDAMFPNGEYWRAYGFILAWPLFLYNVFTGEPLAAWLVISFLQTFVLIPWLIYRYGKGAYCGWICSCGALAETLGDAQRHKMPHGPLWNRLNMVGQAALAACLFLLALRVMAWLSPGGAADSAFQALLHRVPYFNYSYSVDLVLSGVLGIGCYFWFSGRVWCRFACPLAALMHIYARFSRFRIFAEKSKCISCNVCTSVCHQGIDVMSFANRGLPLEDPQCVRCSACVQMCPTGVLSFGEIDPLTGRQLRRDSLPASLVQLTEHGRPRQTR